MSIVPTNVLPGCWPPLIILRRYVGAIVLLVFYLFAVMAVFLFGANDPWHFDTLRKCEE